MIGWPLSRHGRTALVLFREAPRQREGVTGIAACSRSGLFSSGSHFSRTAANSGKCFLQMQSEPCQVASTEEMKGNHSRAICAVPIELHQTHLGLKSD